MAHVGGGVNLGWPGPAATRPGFPELFAALPVAAVALDESGCIVHANVASEHLLNLSERAMRGLSLEQIVAVPDGYARREPGHGFVSFQANLPLRRGGRIQVDFLEGVLGDDSGWRVVVLHHAPPAHRSDGGGVRSAAGAAAMLGHEIKNPLSGIRGAAQLIGDADGVERPALTDLIIDEVDRIAALIDRMQGFTDDRPLELVPTNIYPTLAHVRRVAQAGFARGIPIEERFDPSLPEVRIDRDAFVQLLLNLVKNAAEAVSDVPTPSIVLATAYRHGMAVTRRDGRRMPVPIELSVIDNGPGAAPEIAPHLFEPFVSGKREGQGLGLSLVDKLVRDMGGIVQYAREGEPEMTVFRILLPRA